MMKLEIIYEDDHLIAFNKPSGLLSIPDRYNAQIPNLFHEVNKKFGKLWILHRLDKDTSGVICFAKDEDTHRHISQLFQHHEIEKYYIALCHGKPFIEKGSIKEPIAEHPVSKGLMYVHKKGKPSHTDYEVLQRWNGYSLIKLQIHTGRTHQIRVHLKHLGHPVVADPFYGSGKSLLLSQIKKNFKLSKNQEEERPLLNRLALHSFQLKFKKSEEGDLITIEAPLPKDLKAVVNQLDKWNK